MGMALPQVWQRGSFVPAFLDREEEPSDVIVITSRSGLRGARQHEG
jgi:hypothetical protein